MQGPGDYQPTPLSDESAGQAGEEATGQDAPSEQAADAGALELPAGIARRTGVVFVHGIGTQTPAETFLDWSAPIVDLLTEWRTARDGALPASSTENLIVDPVWRAEFSFSAASPPYLEINVPAHADLPETTWVVTEAWWASDIRPPDIGRTIDYLRRRMGTLVAGIATGYRERAPHLLDVAIDADVLGTGRPPLSWRLIEGLDRGQARAFGAQPLGWLIAAGGTLALIGYDLLRRIPVKAIQDFAVRRMIDSFLVDWFGDLPILIDDPVQGANVRARLAGAIRRLEEDGCDAIVLVAHSGGALVSFATLLDPAYAHLRVDKLITLGQGLGLAWRLAADPQVHEITPGSRLVGNLAAVRPGLRWVDVWSSYDPAPAGPLPARGGLTASAGDIASTTAVVETGEGTDEPWLVRADVGAVVPASDVPRIVVESRPVTNEMNVLTDHGGYWANPEGFLVPLVRHIDAALGGAASSRFFRSKTDRTRRIVWRRQRVAALAAWGWLSAAATAITIVGLAVLGLAGDPRLSPAGDALADAWSLVPGHQLISGPIDGIGALIQGMADAIGLGGAVETLASFGPALLAVAFTVVVFFAMVKIGLWRWHDWDRRERRAMLPEVPALPDRSKAAAQAIALTGGLMGLVLASFGWAIPMVIVLAVAGIGGVLVWAARPFRPRVAGPSPAPASARRRPAPGTPRRPRAGPRTARRASRTPRRSG